ncbi:MAG: hypothetical protein RLZZ242_299 [Bacteroidota bacterium]|jgi:deoxyribodipyrimidine photo-lyase
MKTNKAVVLLNEGLRTQDHPLLEMGSRHEGLKAVYLIETKPILLFDQAFQAKGLYARKFELESLADTQEALHRLGINLHVLSNDAESLMQFIRTHDISTVYSTLLSTTFEKRMKQKLLGYFEVGAIRWVEAPVSYLIKPEQAPFLVQSLPEVFTVFRKKIEAQLRIEAPKKAIEALKTNRLFSSEKPKLPTLQTLGYAPSKVDRRSAHPFLGGEQAAHHRVKDYFFDRQLVSRYKQTRNELIGEAYSTKFSAYLAMGCISASSIYHYLKSYESTVEQNEDTYWVFFELLWRDYFKFLSLKHQDHLFKLSGIQRRTYPWQRDKDLFFEWVHGETKDAFVNAIMRELKYTGYTSNRGRQNAASYWAKTLKQDWRIGATYFQVQLIDYDVHSNWGNWNYVSGVGNDPRDRVFNTKLQAERYDPHRQFQRLWAK